MSLSLTVLGSAGSYPGPGDACSGYLLRTPDATVVVDLGPGTLANLQRHVELDQLDALVLTHEHPDHWVDLPTLRNAMRYYLDLAGLAVYGTAGTLEKASAVIDGLEPTLEWTVTDEASKVVVGDLTMRFSRTDHPVETLAVRVDQAAGSGGRTLAYSSDSGPGWSAFEGLIAGVDLFVCEATVSPAAEGAGVPHLSGRQAGHLARAGGVGRLLLSHIAPGVDRAAQREAAESVFGGPVSVAVDGATVVV